MAKIKYQLLHGVHVQGVFPEGHPSAGKDVAFGPGDVFETELDLHKRFDSVVGAMGPKFRRLLPEDPTPLTDFAASSFVQAGDREPKPASRQEEAEDRLATLEQQNKALSDKLDALLAERSTTPEQRQAVSEAARRGAKADR